MKKKAIGLIEVVISTAILLISIGGILTVLYQNRQLGMSMERAYIAANLARSRIDRLREIRRDKGYAELAYATESGIWLDKYGNPDSGADWVRSTEVDTTYKQSDGLTLTKVTVKVSYKVGATLSAEPVEVVTVISPYYQ